ncbi:hypothetical protein B0J11DRAFT_610182 [Dendryphion nanum]|uniref:Uncharacterized protein n=1 Tax=Dendryphion nanum TaxID=256645 RepID=A0A9P9IWW9_9PLEO|nr:hypothetical protein B0J11DRAFT_610182 [Dendryphion nanum]
MLQSLRPKRPIISLYHFSQSPQPQPQPLSIRSQWRTGSSNASSRRWTSHHTHPQPLSPLPKKPPPPHQPSQNPDPPNPTLPPLNIFTLLRDQSPTVRRSVLGFLAVLATLETSFWIKVLHSKFFAVEDDGFWEKYLAFLKGVRGVWMRNYGGWWEGGMWGL